MTSDLIERMAEALCLEQEAASYSELDPLGQTYYRASAKAAAAVLIEAMREWNDKHKQGMGTEMVIRTFLDAFAKEKLGE